MKLDERVRERLAALMAKGEGVRVVLELGRDAYGEYTGWRTQAIVCLMQVFGSTHTYTESFESATAGRVHPGRANAGLGILHVALEDVEQGHLDTLQQMAFAEVFSDFLDQAARTCLRTVTSLRRRLWRARSWRTAFARWQSATTSR